MKKRIRSLRKDSGYLPLLEVLSQLPPGGVTLDELAEISGLRRSTAGRLLRQAHANGDILVGKREKPPGSVGRRLKTYAIKAAG
tara:strand:+ start:1751 stop:2002 length:252 start_codon:yes stop_codon:yes gene_type:complete